MPPIISEVNKVTANDFKTYAFNAQPEGQSPTAYQVTLKHFYANNCYALDAITPTYFIFAGIWGAIALVFAATLYLMPEQSRLNI